MSQDFDHDLFFLLHDVARLSRVEADKRARSTGMTRAQWGLLLRLEKNPGLSQKEIADLLEVEPISVARLVDRLEANGFVERRADAEDRRIWRLHLRPAAMGLMAPIKAERDDLAAFVTAGIAAPMREAMVAALRRMKANLTQAEPAKLNAAEPAKLNAAEPAKLNAAEPAKLNSAAPAVPACTVPTEMSGGMPAPSIKETV